MNGCWGVRSRKSFWVRLFSTGRSKSKVFLIPEADRLQWEAANALLKVLEEPPEDACILLGEIREAIPATIGRVQTIRLRRLEPSDISSWAERCLILKVLTGGGCWNVLMEDPEGWNFQAQLGCVARSH